MSENKRLRIDFNGLLWRLLQAAPVDHWPTMDVDRGRFELVYYAPDGQPLLLVVMSRDADGCLCWHYIDFRNDEPARFLDIEQKVKELHHAIQLSTTSPESNSGA